MYKYLFINVLNVTPAGPCPNCWEKNQVLTHSWKKIKLDGEARRIELKGRQGAKGVHLSQI